MKVPWPPVARLEAAHENILLILVTTIPQEPVSVQWSIAVLHLPSPIFQSMQLKLSGMSMVPDKPEYETARARGARWRWGLATRALRRGSKALRRFARISIGRHLQADGKSFVTCKPCSARQPNPSLKEQSTDFTSSSMHMQSYRLKSAYVSVLTSV